MIHGGVESDLKSAELGGDQDLVPRDNGDLMVCPCTTKFLWMLTNLFLFTDELSA